MPSLIRVSLLCTVAALVAAANGASADYEGASGYGSPASDMEELEVSHDGYPSADPAPAGAAASSSVSADAPNYIVIEVDDGASQKVDGETVIVVQEPEPTAATEQAPPAPRAVVPVDQQPVCSGGIWVDAYWAYADGQYVWVDGHCVVERVNYVFVHPRWDFYGNVWWFVPGYYRPCSVWVGFGYHRPWYWFPPHHHAYYRHHRGVPVHRGVARRPTTAHPVRPARGVTPSARVPATGRTPSVGRRPPVRTPSVSRQSPVRTPSVARPAPGRAPTVVRSTPTRAPSLVRSTPIRTPSIARSTPSRSPAVVRAAPTRTPSMVRSTPTRAPTIDRGTSTRAPSVGRVRSSPSMRSPSTRPRTGISSGRFGGIGQSSTSPARSGSAVRRPSLGPSRMGVGGGGFARPSMSPSRSSFGRPGGLSRPSSGGFGGSRSVPSARGR